MRPAALFPLLFAGLAGCSSALAQQRPAPTVEPPRPGLQLPSLGKPARPASAQASKAPGTRQRSVLPKLGTTESPPLGLCDGT